MRIDKKLGIRYPLIQGGMANIATGEFAAAVSNAGALGLIGAGGWTVEQVEEQIAICKKLTDKPFGVNLMLMNPQAEQIADLLAKEKI
ncbi:MAG: nitronate monooxygenase, partial [Lachnospiraceae bacterium]|nr:nitronate monooxygenase [Lachnospiraceae bacterium]